MCNQDFIQDENVKLNGVSKVYRNDDHLTSRSHAVNLFIHRSCGLSFLPFGPGICLRGAGQFLLERLPKVFVRSHTSAGAVGPSAGPRT